jgi:probable 2-oxoglutarate dehydrogenase E1 component DHKTD1
MLLELSKAEKMNIHQSLVQTEALDHYLHKKFNNFKRYSGEGSESMIIFLKNLFS